jgi:hypothetical protein
MITTGALLDAARARTGLRDFGEDSFLEPFERLVDSINRESRLSAVGQIAGPEMLIHALINRLEIESWYARHPEIDDQQIIAPVFGVGLPRTGSTALGFILSLDRNTRVLRDWEANRPCPPPESATEFTDPRIAATQAANDAFEALVPELPNMLPRAVEGPTECYYLLTYSFSTSALETFFNVPSYSAWLSSSAFDMEPAYRYHQRVIKLLQWRCPPRRWFLRSPPHLFGLDALFKVYPDARFVMTHRDPVKSVPSTCSLMHHLRSAFVENPEPEQFGPAQAELWAMALKRALAFRERVGEDRFYDISHRRQTKNPAEQIRGLYEKLGWPLDEQLESRIAAWQEVNPKGPHQAQAASFALDPAQLAARYRFYTERFGEWL